MREKISKNSLADKIRNRMFDECAGSTIGSDPKAFWAAPVRCEREGDGPNWRWSFSSEKIPQGYEKIWERIRHEYEDKYDMEEE